MSEGAVPGAPRAGAPRALAAAAVIVALGVAVYLPALRGGFVFDDHELVAGGQVLRGPLSAIWLGTAARDWWPLTYSALWAEWRLFGADPAGYHVVGVALHLATALLLWRVLGRLRVPGAWLAGALFAVHPVAVESVAWISEQKNGLSGVLWLAAVLAWLRHEEARRPARYAAALALFAAALLAKVSVVVLPVVLLGLVAARRRPSRGDALALAPFAVLAAGGGAVNVWFQHRLAMAGGWAPARGWAERIGGAGWALAAYLEKAFVPVRLALLYPPWPVGPERALFWAPLAGLAAAAALLWWARRRGARPVLLAVGYHAVCVGPVLGLVDMAFLRLSPISNHLQYLALMGPVALAAWLLGRAAARAPRAAAAGAAVLVAALAAVASGRAAAFHDDGTLWEAAARDAPESAAAREAHGYQLLEAGREAEGLAELERAAALAREPGARHAILGAVLLARGRPAEAAREARAAVAATGSPERLSDAAWTLVQAGAAGEALPVLGALVARAPGASEYAYRLSVALVRVGRTPEAIEVLRAYCRVRPGHPRLEPALALLLVRSGRAGEARARAAEVLGVDAADPRAEAQLRAWWAEATGGAPPPR